MTNAEIYDKAMELFNEDKIDQSEFKQTKTFQ